LKLGVIILNWNGLADTRDCLKSLLPAPMWAKVYVVDNGSTDKSVETLRQEFGPEISLVETGKNLLFAGGNNVGIQTAQADGCETVLLLNNDTLVDPQLLIELRKASEEFPVQLLCPKILYAADRNKIWYAGGIWKKGRIAHRGIRQLDKGQFDLDEPTDWGTGCALWIPQKVIDRVGVLDDDFKLYYEDVEFCLRAKAHGFETRYVPSAKLWHKVSASLGGHGTFRKQRRKLASLSLLLKKINAPFLSVVAAYLNFFLLDPLRALKSNLIR